MSRSRLTLLFLVCLLLVFSSGCSRAAAQDSPAEGGSSVSQTAGTASGTTAGGSSSAPDPTSADAAHPTEPAEGSSYIDDTAPPSPNGASASQPPSSQPTASPAVKQEGEMRAVWISYYELDGRGKNQSQFADMIGGMFDRVKDMGLNTVVVHVRANSDAFYPSAYFPWSEYAAGQQGKDPGYDPLALMIEAAHARGLAFHAWLNPYRVSNKSGDPATLADNNPAKTYLTDGDPANDDWAVCWGNGMYYNPGVVQMQKLILDGVREILDHYQVDGIHFDDYFYPTTDPAFDQKAYGDYAAKAGKNAMSLGDWRRANVNTLMQAVYRLADSKGIPFGISPSAHVSADGSDKNYQELYADAALWMRAGGYAHYITPQLYFGFDYPKVDFRFDALLDRWLSLPRAAGVRLYTGMAAYKIGEADAGSGEWQEKTDVLARQLTLNRQRGADGFMLYSYGSIVSTAERNQAQMKAFADALS